MIVAEVTGDVQTDYYYDESGNVFGFKRGDSEYYYIRNGQGDIIGILDSSGTQIVSYVYDSWGKLVSVTDASGNDKSGDASFIGNLNPFRYRGYYYDTETGLYYLNSRYYDPEVGRFINADGILGGNLDVLSYNLFAYCSNNPVNYCDPTGNNIFSDIWEGLTELFTGFIADYDSVSLSRANRKKGKTPPSSWPPLPDNIGGKNQSGIPMVIGKEKRETLLGTVIHMGLASTEETDHKTVIGTMKRAIDGGIEKEIPSFLHLLPNGNLIYQSFLSILQPDILHHYMKYLAVYTIMWSHS